jgi:lysophospholipase L1-like esterase
MPFVSTTAYLAPNGTPHHAWYWLAGVEVTASRQTGAVAILGDSVTDGTGSTADGNNRWTDHLARRLMAVNGNHRMAVLNQGIAGNKLLNEIVGANGLARYDRDVLSQTAVTHVIAFLGNNDIIFVFNPAELVSVDQIIVGHKQLIRRARARGLVIYGATLTPFGGFFFYSAEKESKRQAVNHWIRTSGEYDAVIDFDAALRDPNDPTRLRSGGDTNYASDDHLHPNDAGYAAMAAAVDLALFKERPQTGDGIVVNHAAITRMLTGAPALKARAGTSTQKRMRTSAPFRLLSSSGNNRMSAVCRGAA